MYNESVKQRFINEQVKSEKTAKTYLSIFTTLERFEEKYNSDICSMSKDELQETLNLFTSITFGESKEDYRITYLRDYVKWCVDNNIPNANDNMMHTIADATSKVRKKWISSPLHLKKHLDELFESEEARTTTIVYRAFLWLAYLGVKKEDTCKLKITDVDFDERCIIYNDKKLEVHREAWNTIKYAAELTDFNYNHPLYSKTIVRHRVDSDILLRGVKANPNPRTFSMKILHTYDILHPEADTRRENPLAFENVWLSGWFYRIYELERAGMLGDNPFGELVDIQTEGITYHYKGGELEKPNASIRNSRIRAQKRNYERWKLAFLC